MRTVRLAIGSLCLTICGLCNAADLSNYIAAVEYVRSLATTYDLQMKAKTEFDKAKDSTSRLMAGVKMSTRQSLKCGG